MTRPCFHAGNVELVPNHFSEMRAILKARTNNFGRVTLASARPWDLPEINFQYFGDGLRANDPDLEAVVSGVKFVRAMNRTESKSTHNQLTRAQQTSERLDHPVVNVSWLDAVASLQ